MKTLFFSTLLMSWLSTSAQQAPRVLPKTIQISVAVMAADVGLSNKPAGAGMPWLMDEGTYKAHIMINP